MTSRTKFIRHIFAGGWATDFGPTSEAAVDNLGRVNIPFLINAENVEYDLDGGPKKIGGTKKLNSTVLESGAIIRGLFDYWRQGTAGSPAQKRVVHVGTKIYQDDADGTFTELFSGLDSDSIPSYEVFDDILIISQTGGDVPKSWDQTTAQNLAGTPPNFSFCTTHKNRLWAAGVVTNPSTLYYSVEFDPEDWVGSGSGSIQINPGDGDSIVALASFKNELWVFKGPYRGSIHRITGSSPTGSDAFARVEFISKGLGAVSHNLLFRFKDDLGFVWNDASIHTLKSVDQFGDYNEVALSRPIASWLREHVNFNALKKGWAATLEHKGIVYFSIAVDSSTTNNAILMMDYRFSPVRWAYWTAFNCPALAAVIDPTNNDLRVLMGGFDDGFVRLLNKQDFSIDGITAITALVTSPSLHYDDPAIFKHISAASVGILPKGDYNLVFRWYRDTKALQSVTIDQGGGDVLSPADSNVFILGTSTLGGSAFVDRFKELSDGGEFRSIRYEMTNSGVNEGMEIHSFSARIRLGAESFEN